MKTKYAFQGMKENMARALSKDLGISTKVSIEIANFLRGRSSAEAKVILERVLKKKQPIPFKRFTDGVGHRKGAGLASGRFPEKASEAFLTLIKQCEANAQAKGLSSDLRIVHLVPQKGTNMFRHGRQRRRTYKRTHLEIVLEEMEPVKKEKKPVSKKKEAVSEKKTAKAESSDASKTNTSPKEDVVKKDDVKKASAKEDVVKKDDVKKDSAKKDVESLKDDSSKKTDEEQK